MVTVETEIPNPKGLTDEEIQLLRRLAELSGKSVREERTVMDRVKDLFAG